MVKLKTGQIILLVAVFLVSIILITGIDIASFLPGAVTGGITGGTLIKSISAVQFESNIQNIAESNYIIQLQVDGSSDSLIGNGIITSETLERIAGGEVNIERDFTLSARKVKNDFVVPIKTLIVPTFIFEILQENQGVNARSPNFLETDTEGIRREMARQLYDECVSQKGQTFAGFGWQREDPGFNLFGARGICYFKNTVLNVFEFDLQNIILDWQVDFEMAGKTTQRFFITDEKFGETLSFPGGFGTIRWTGNNIGNTLPPQVGPYKPATAPGSSLWITVPSDAQAPINAIASFESDFFSFSQTPNTLATGSKVAEVNGIVGRFIIDRGIYDLSLGKIVLPLDSSINPEFQITLKADFVGILRTATRPALTCQNTRVPNISAGQEHAISLGVINQSSSPGSIFVNAVCPNATFRLSPNINPAPYSGNETKNFTLFVTSGNPANLTSCYVEATDVAQPSSKSGRCSITGSFTQPDFCGDGVCNAGETNQTCSNDCEVTCGNGRVDVGESCVTCEVDVSCPSGTLCNRSTQACETQRSCNNNNTCEANLGETKLSCPNDCDGVEKVCGLFGQEGILFKETTRIKEEKSFGIDFKAFGIFPIQLFEEAPVVTTTISCGLDLTQVAVIFIAFVITFGAFVFFISKKKAKRRRKRR